MILSDSTGIMPVLRLPCTSVGISRYPLETDVSYLLRKRSPIGFSEIRSP